MPGSTGGVGRTPRSAAPRARPRWRSESGGFRRVGGANPFEEMKMNLDFLKRYFREREVYRRAVRELSLYTDSELRELGLDRLDIPRIARQAARG